MYKEHGDWMVKTTIDIPDEKWKKFSIKVIEEYGGRKKNDVIEELIDAYLNERKKEASKK
jgi:metal-responsive CopG/Arc/MetJ family transcriptional regulator